MNQTNRVLDENFEMSRIEGKTIAEVDEMGLEFESAYPVVEDGVVVGIVDANYPDELNGGNWEVVNDSYAVAAQ